MKRLREMDVADSVKACVIAGPGDLMTWEVTACVDSGGMTLEVIGRGSDLEAAAASAFGPFAPGTEPSLAECSADTQVRDVQLLDLLTRLMPNSPNLPAAEDTLAGG